MTGRAYDRVVVFLRATTARGRMNAVEETWTEFARAFAKRTPVSDGERDRAEASDARAQVGAHRTDRFETWWTDALADLGPKDRLQCEGKTFDITAVKEKGGYHDRLEITAAARAD